MERFSVFGMMINKIKYGKNYDVVATNALELGIDVGHIDVTLHLGFPGSIARRALERDKKIKRSLTSLTRLTCQEIYRYALMEMGLDAPVLHVAMVTDLHIIRSMEDGSHYCIQQGLLSSEFTKKKRFTQEVITDTI
ncbi:nucleic acid-binding protein [Tanacetum coccineum]